MPANPNNIGRTTTRKRNRQRGKVRAGLLAPTSRTDKFADGSITYFSSRDTNGARAIYRSPGNPDSVRELEPWYADLMVGDCNRELTGGSLTVLIATGCSRFRANWAHWQETHPLATCKQLTRHVETDNPADVLDSLKIYGYANGIASYGMGTIDALSEYWTIDAADTYALSMLCSAKFAMESHLSKGERVSAGSGAGPVKMRARGKGAKASKASKVSETQYANLAVALAESRNQAHVNDHAASLPGLFAHGEGI